MLSHDLKRALLNEQYKENPVLWAEDHLKFIADPWQANFLRSKSNRIILNCARQTGKSTSTAILALWEAIHKRNSMIVLDSPSLRQSQELMLKVSEFLGMIHQEVKIDSDTKLSVRFNNGSRILALPGSEKTIRGISAVSLFIEDEASRVPDELYKSIRPMLAVSQGRLILLSTPYGQQGHFYEIWSKGEDWEKIEVKASQCPRIPAEFLQEEREALGSLWYAQEYECQFVSSADARIKREWLQYEDIIPKELKITMGVDLAISEKASADYTAAAVLGRDGSGLLHVLDVQRIRGSFASQLDFIKSLAAKYQPVVVAVEDVAYQRVMVQSLSQQTNLTVKGIRPDSDKVARFSPLEARYEQHQVYHARDLPIAFEAELLSFPMGEHDDQIDAFSLAWVAQGQILEQLRIPTKAITGSRS